MRFPQVVATVSVAVLTLGMTGSASAQTCLVPILCVRRTLPSPPPVPPPAPPAAPALPPADALTEPATGVVDNVGGALRTPVAVLESQMLNLINAERASAGIAPLAMSGWAQSFARGFSEKMMAAGTIWHNQEYFAKGRAAMGADLLSENVGYDSSIPANHIGFMRSPSHRVNILDARLTHAGIGVAVSPSGRVYVTEDFARIPGSVTGVRRPNDAVGASAKAGPPPVTLAVANAAQSGELEPETISLGQPSGKVHSDALSGSAAEPTGRLVSSQSPAPLVPGLVVGTVIALTAAGMFFGRKLLYVLRK